MKREEVEIPRRRSEWMEIFQLSPVNGAAYRGEELPVKHWTWPRGTYLQRKLEARGNRREGED